jgi:hypothetical protein
MERTSKGSSNLLLILAFTALVIAGAATGNVALGTLAGTVTDSQDRPVGGATVTIETSDGLNPRATHTDANGEFQFTRFRPGQYDLRAFGDGVFSDWTKRVLIRTGKKTEVMLRLRPVSPPR